MPAAPKLKPTIYFRGGHWRIREPLPPAHFWEAVSLWVVAYTYIHQLNQHRRV